MLTDSEPVLPQEGICHAGKLVNL